MHDLDQSTTKLAFVGLGNMGSRIAKHLLAAGYRVSVFDLNRSRSDALEKDGATPVDSLAELAKSGNVLLSSLTDDQAVRSVYYGPAGVLANASPGLVVLELSTIAPATSRELATKASELGVKVLDVAISGSTPAADAGTLFLLVGGDPDLFQAARPIFQSISSHHFLLGPSGAGTTMKLAVNAILGIGMQAIAEATAFGEKAGLNRDVLLQVLAETAVIAPAHVGKLPRAARGDYSPQFPLPLMHKDFGLILQVAADVRAPMPATSASFKVNDQAMVRYADQDFSAVIPLMEQGTSVAAPAASPAASLRVDTPAKISTSREDLHPNT
jgi:3-hydroxyisobutyrate dehydrogenase-like beta-hydroxyacid dehydrogenase